MSDSEDQRNETEARPSDPKTTSRKKNRRKLESDDDEVEVGLEQEETPVETVAAADEDADNSDAEIENMSENELAAKIKAMEAQLKGKNVDKSDVAGPSKKRGDKAASKAASKVTKMTKDDVNVHPTILAFEKSRRRRKNEMTDDEKQSAAQALIILMKECVAQDNKANSQKKPALQKLFLLDQVTKELRKIPLQEHFIENGGCVALADWLKPLPDGTYPNVKVVQEILQVIETLHIESVFLQSSKLALVVKIYSKNHANMSQVQDLAKRIMDKWSRMVFGISTSYFGAGGVVDDDDMENNAHDQDQYRDLRRKIDRQKAHQMAQRDLEDDSDEAEQGERKAAKSKPKISHAQAVANEITRGRAGIIMPSRNAFDFVEKPRQQEDFDSRGSSMLQSKGHEKIKKAMNSIKRQSKINLVNRRMQTVKSDL